MEFKKRYIFVIIVGFLVAFIFFVLSIILNNLENKQKNLITDYYNLIEDSEKEIIEYLKERNVDENLESSYTKKVPILLYHHITEDVKKNGVEITPELFESHMQALSANGYNALTIDDIVSYVEDGVEFPDRSVLITFDDGYMSNYEYAYPILKKYGLKATIFVIGSTFGSSTYKDTNISITPHFGTKEMEEMEQSGIIQIEYHTYDLHQTVEFEEGIVYDNILIKEGESILKYSNRLREDYTKWENTVGKKITAMAYPHGKSDMISLTILKNMGIKLTFTTEPQTNIIVKDFPLSGYNLGRYNINQNYTVEEVLALIS